MDEGLQLAAKMLTKRFAGECREMNKTLMKILCLSTLWAASVDAGDLVIDGTVTKVANTSSNLTNFAILVSGGSLNICAPGWINFPVSAAADVEVHKRAYANALLALATGARVRVHNYAGSTCEASYIELTAP
jgi:hypothetical protein